MYAVAFFAALRVGELAHRGSQPGQNIINISQVTFLKTREGTKKLCWGATSIVTMQTYSIKGRPISFVTWIFRTIRIVALGSVLLPGQQRKLCQTHRSGILDAETLIRFRDIYEPPQWGLCQPSRRSSVPFPHACMGIPYRHNRLSQTWHRCGMQGPLVSVLCLS